MRRALAIVLALPVVAGLSGCDKKKGSKGTAAIQVKSLAGAAALTGTNALSAAVRAQAAAAGYQLDGADTKLVSFTPTSVLAPIYGIALAENVSGSGGANGTVYHCAGGADDCSVDLTSQAALDKLAASADVDTATYGYASIDQCNGGTTITYKVKGQLTGADGTTYYTTADTSVLTTNAAQLDYAAVTSRCYPQFYPIPSGAAVTKGATTTVKLYLSMKNAAFGGVGSTPSDMCSVSSDKAMSLCFYGIIPIPSAATTTATLESYKIASGQMGAGELDLVFDASDNFVGGMAKLIYDGVNHPSLPFNANVRSVTKNADGSYTVASFGSNQDVNGASLYTFPGFKRAAHEGSVTGTGGSFSYSAAKM